MNMRTRLIATIATTAIALTGVATGTATAAPATEPSLSNPLDIEGWVREGRYPNNIQCTATGVWYVATSAAAAFDCRPVAGTDERDLYLYYRDVAVRALSVGLEESTALSEATATGWIDVLKQLLKGAGSYWDDCVNAVWRGLVAFKNWFNGLSDWLKEAIFEIGWSSVGELFNDLWEYLNSRVKA
ncbi:hypothetical protein [Actinokineospora xionganensis]|uniref:Secreted protein n=1 Tax=Actinokineospora xionganensis TaxID=2684470 RepID=A0ABR7L5M5_9PSEU|nr:hypothetical protein [Actinokineospora xionganensis]MBC6447973.1 hypothetical protein [Actinokineospora xionganensis]